MMGYEPKVKKQTTATLIDINRVYLQVFMEFGFPAFMPVSVGVGDTNVRWCLPRKSIQLYHILLFESKLPLRRFLPHFPMYSDANNSAGIRSTQIPSLGIDAPDRHTVNRPSKRQNPPFSSHNYYYPTGFMQPLVHSPRLMMT